MSQLVSESSFPSPAMRTCSASRGSDVASSHCLTYHQASAAAHWRYGHQRRGRRLDTRADQHPKTIGRGFGRLRPGIAPRNWGKLIYMDVWSVTGYYTDE